MTHDAPLPARFSAFVRRHRDAALRRKLSRLLAGHRSDAVPVSFFPPSNRDEVGHLGFDTGRIDVVVKAGEIRTRWTGRGRHAFPETNHSTRSVEDFLVNLRRITTRHFVNMRGTEAGPHHMLI